MEININEVMEKFDDLVGSLTYSCYRFNRERSPDITPEKWGSIFKDVEKMEVLYQAEKQLNLT